MDGRLARDRCQLDAAAVHAAHLSRRRHLGVGVWHKRSGNAAAANAAAAAAGAANSTAFFFFRPDLQISLQLLFGTGTFTIGGTALPNEFFLAISQRTVGSQSIKSLFVFNAGGSSIISRPDLSAIFGSLAQSPGDAVTIR